MQMPHVLAERPGGWILFKPAGWLTRSPSGGAGALGAAAPPVLTDWIQRELGPPLLVHRLDRETSGVLCVARDADTQRRWSVAFQERRASKGYELLASGEPEASVFKCTSSIEGKSAVTQVEVVRHFAGAEPPVFHARARIATGRRHQVRKHLAELGYPLLGDREYAGLTQLARPALAIPRVALHARWLQLPDEGRFESPFPPDWLEWMQRLEAIA